MITIRKGILILILILGLTGIAQAEPLEFRGFVMGMTKEEVKTNVIKDIKNFFPTASRTFINLHYKCFDTACKYSTRIKGKWVDVFFVFDYSFDPDIKKLDFIRIEFSPLYYNDLEDALIEKYGKPDSQETEIIQTRMGAEFLNKTAYWKTSGGAISISKYGSDIETGRIGMLSNECIEMEKKEKLKRKSSPGF